MTATLGFDVYGTLIDHHGMVDRLADLVGPDAAEPFSCDWREKQLEYSFRRALMANYQDFAVCTRQALQHTAERYGVELTPAVQDELLEGYRHLPAFPDAAPALAALRTRGLRLYAFSNGSVEAVEAVLSSAGLREHLLGVISVEDLRSYKPNPAVYAHFLRSTDSTGDRAWLISSNPFDVIGAISAGLRGAWVRRSPNAVFDPWGIDPTVMVTILTDLSGHDWNA